MNATKNKGLLILALSMALIMSAPLGVNAAAAPSVMKSPPGGAFKKVSALVPLPDYIPGLGTLYVDPATLPVGPFLGYDRQGRLVNITYMIPLADLTKEKAFTGLGANLSGLPVDHTDVVFNPGHPGVPEAHYHITLWLVDTAAQKKM